MCVAIALTATYMYYLLFSEQIRKCLQENNAVVIHIIIIRYIIKLYFISGTRF